MRTITAIALLTMMMCGAVYAARYCTFSDGSGERVYCLPGDPGQGDGMCEDTCQMEDGEDGYCPDYTSAEEQECLTQCFTPWGTLNCDDFCFPSMAHTCTIGRRP